MPVGLLRKFCCLIIWFNLDREMGIIMHSYSAVIVRRDENQVLRYKNPSKCFGLITLYYGALLKFGSYKKENFITHIVKFVKPGFFQQLNMHA